VHALSVLSLPVLSGAEGSKDELQPPVMGALLYARVPTACRTH
jgi:hypothetical protein